MKVGISQNHLSKIALVLGGSRLFKVGWEWLAGFWDQASWIWKAALVGLSPILIFMITIFIALGAVAFSMATSVFKHWKLSLWLQGSLTKAVALHLTQGLLKRQSIQIALHKIQWVMWENTLIRRMFWMNTIIRQSMTGGGSESTSASELDKNSSLCPFPPWTVSAQTSGRHSFSNLARTKLLTLRPARYAFWFDGSNEGNLEPSIVTSRMDVGMGDFAIFGSILWSWIGWVSWKVYQGQWATTMGVT